MSPLHSGIEGSRVALLAIGLDPSTLTTNVQLSGLVYWPQNNIVHPQEAFSNTFMDFIPTTINTAGATATLNMGSSTGGPTIVRIQLTNSGQIWNIYAPAAATIAIPNVPAARTAVLGTGVGGYMAGVRTPASFSDVFKLGSGKGLDHAVDNIEAFLIEECKTGMTTSCTLQ
jgi:hypothetical protein